jgi:hypothetical protein
MLSLVAAALALSQSVEADAVPKARAEIEAACGSSPIIAIKWEGFGEDDGAAAGLAEGGLGFLSGAFGEVCKDAGLKAEVGEQISKIVLIQAYGAADPIIYLMRGTLHIEYLWVKGQAGPDAAFVRDEIASRLRGEEAEAP